MIPRWWFRGCDCKRFWWWWWLWLSYRDDGDSLLSLLFTGCEGISRDQLRLRRKVIKMSWKFLRNSSGINFSSKKFKALPLSSLYRTYLRNRAMLCGANYISDAKTSDLKVKGNLDRWPKQPHRNDFSSEAKNKKKTPHLKYPPILHISIIHLQTKRYRPHPSSTLKSLISISKFQTSTFPHYPPQNHWCPYPYSKCTDI